MTAIGDFKASLDSGGRLDDQKGSLIVAFATTGGARFPGKLFFSNGLCVRAEMEGGATGQAELLAAVQNFNAVADQVPSNKPATGEQFRNASVAFEKFVKILERYLPLSEEARQVESALRAVEFPPWVVN